MALGNWDDLTRPNRQNEDPADEHALVIEEFTGLVEGTIERRSLVEPWIPLRDVKGTATITNYAVGEATLGKVTPGEAPTSSKTKFSKTSLTIDTVVYARNAMPLIDEFQQNFDKRQQISLEQGKKIAKFRDQSFLIQAYKAAQLTKSAYDTSTTTIDGHFGGNRQTLESAADRTDPAKLYYNLGKLLEQFELKDVDPLDDDVMIVLNPSDYYTLLNAEQLINSTLITSAGNSIESKVLKAFGVPVLRSNNLPSGTIENHFLGSEFDGDFSDLVAVAFSPRALLAGETIPVRSDVFYDKIFKQWFVDSEMSYGVTPNRAEYAGALLLP